MGRPARWVAIVVLTFGCSGSKSTAPTGTPAAPSGPSIGSGTAYTVQSGDTDQPVAGANVTLTGQSASGAFTATYTTDASGQFDVDRAVLLSPAPQLDIRAGGFLARSTLLRTGETTVTLWPSTSATGLDENFTETAVYSPSGCPTSSTGVSPLRKAASTAGTVEISLGPTLQDAITQTVIQGAVARLNDALGGSPTYELTASPPANAVSFVLNVDASDPSCVNDGLLHAVTFLTFSGDGNINGGRLAFCTAPAARLGDLVLHELGHTVGLYHSSSPSDVMYCTAGRPTSFSARERLAMKLMRERRSGTRWPDNDRSTAAALLVRPGYVERIACAERPR